MIHVTRRSVPEPQVLVDNAETWTTELLADLAGGASRDRYAHQEVKDALKAMFGAKCAYCEGDFTACGDVNVEHFRPKSKYPRFAYKWTNLLQTCVKCNRPKNNYFPLMPDERDAIFALDNDDTDDALLVDPCRDDPNDFFEFECEVIVAKNRRGILMRDTCKLDRDELDTARRRRLVLVQDAIMHYETARLIDLPNDAITKATEALRRHIAQDAPFSACARAYIVKRGLGDLLT
jgi:uncharacterized protein (TIGR02646 family)